LLLSVCATDRVVVRPLAMPKVNSELLSRENARAPACDLDRTRAGYYHGDEIKASNACWRLAWAKAAAKHDQLAQAVEHREAKTDEALRAAVR
jgi:hypothetical protein